ncbi:hypothetical protein FBUS_03334 [Fasciolopsis buskii]|uniref:Beta-galactosidase n=1 Tax=Fasciolopsis buskii TaxID=27845 RepID=A0A8E0RR48_9TREM|nr:hypothetical protein FBUS_03334 [Fasciolopsis buski]
MCSSRLLLVLGYLVIFILIQHNSPDYEFNRFRATQQINKPGYHCEACIRLDVNSNTLTRFGIPYQFIGGQIDYFRIPLIYWEDRLQKAKAAGLDVVEFYIPWNFHERSPGSFEFSGQRNISHYLELIKKSGLLAVVRPGPYICAEWTLGGIPPWLWYQSSFVQLRTSHPDPFCEIKNFHLLEAVGPNKPLINNEFYTGWFDNWGKFHKKRSITKLVSSFWRQISYSNRVSLSFYMFHGGTSFGLWNGANTDPFLPQTTTYDYDAPISEAGDLTEKYMRIRKAIFQFRRQKPPPLPRNTTKSVYPSAFLEPVSHLLWLLSNGTESVQPVLMENLKQRYHGSAYRDFPNQRLNFSYTGKGKTLYLLVENRGYVNYGSEVSTDRKGIMHPVYLGEDLLKHWIMYPICFNKDGLFCPGTNILDQLGNPGPGQTLYGMPRMGLIYRGALTINTENELADTFVEPKSFKRGLLYINSILLGRFDQASGPQLTLFVPKSFLRFGINDIVIVDLSGMRTNGKIAFRDQPIWLSGSSKL